MPEPFHELRERLLRAGVAPRHVRRYLNELTDHLADLTAAEELAGRTPEDAQSAALVRLGRMDDLAQAMFDRRQFRSWCVRAPWAVFGLVPLLVLAAAWLVALGLLWFGWRLFLPGASTPFGHRAAQFLQPSNIYFQSDRALFFGAPLLLGWSIAWIAARQRLKAAWPAVGLLLMALLGGTAQIRTRPPALPGAGTHISLGFAFDSSVQGSPFGLLHASVLLSLTALPYLAWRWYRAASRPA